MIILRHSREPMKKAICKQFDQKLFHLKERSGRESEKIEGKIATGEENSL
jgi:hypothetical protein